MSTNFSSHVDLRFAVIPTRDRPGDYADCVRAIMPQVDVIVTVANSQEALEYSYRNDNEENDEVTGIVIEYLTGRRAAAFNISRAWNLGLDACEEHALAAGEGAWNVAVLNDDVVVPTGWFDRLTDELAANVPGASGGRGYGPGDKHMAGFAFVLKGEDRIRADEGFVYWFGDTSLQRQCEELGGFTVVPDLLVEHRHPNSNVKGRESVIAKDKQRYNSLWGKLR